MIKKRIIAYIIDLFIITILTSLIFSLPTFDKERELYLENTQKYQETYQSYTNDGATAEEVIEKEYDMYHSSSTLLIAKVGVTILYFSIIPYYTNYKTLGKKLLKIKIAPVKGDVINPGLFFTRGLITSNVIFDIISIILLLRLPSDTWQTSTIIINYLSYVVYLILLESSILNKNKRGLHDLLLGTKVVEDK